MSDGSDVVSITVGASVGEGLGSSVVVVVVVSSAAVVSSPHMGASKSGGFVGAISHVSYILVIFIQMAFISPQFNVLKNQRTSPSSAYFLSIYLRAIRIKINSITPKPQIAYNN